MSKPVTILAAILFAAVLCAPVPAAGGAPGGAITYAVTAEEGPATIRLFFQERKLRVEVQAEPSPRIEILRVDLRVKWALDPAKMQCVETELAIADWYKYRPSKAFLKNKEVLGREQVLARDCDVYAYKIGSTRSKAWVAPELGVVLKSEAEKDGRLTRLEAVELAPGGQPDSLFQIPRGFTKRKISSGSGGGGGCCGGGGGG